MTDILTYFCTAAIPTGLNLALTFINENKIKTKHEHLDEWRTFNNVTEYRW